VLTTPIADDVDLSQIGGGYNFEDWYGEKKRPSFWPQQVLKKIGKSGRGAGYRLAA